MNANQAVGSMPREEPDATKGHNIIIGVNAAPGYDRDSAVHHCIVIGVDGAPDITPESRASYCIGIGTGTLAGITDEEGVIEIGSTRFVDRPLAEELYTALRKFIDEGTSGWLERTSSDGTA